MAELFQDLFQARTVEEARTIIGGHINIGGIEKVLLLESPGRRLAEDVRALDAVPGFDRSTMDGFAVKARDTFGASESLPAYLDVTGEVLMGREAVGNIGTGQAWRIPTGGMLPPGADAVVMVEYTEELDDRTIGVTRPVAPGDHVVRCGEDISPGARVLSAGQIIRPQDLGLLSSVGLTEVAVALPIRVGIISTGDEVIEPGCSPAPGQVRDINSYALYGQAAACGAKPCIYGIVRDSYELLLDKVRQALAECDIVLLSGGSSVGVRDVAHKVIDSLGFPGVLFHGISIKPGKPTVGAVVDGKPVFGLPGHPVSAMVVFELLVTPLLKYGIYRNNPLEFPVRARMTRNMRSAAGREDYLRVRLYKDEEIIVAEPILGKSGLISTMVQANGLARIPAEKEGVEAGEYVEVKLI
ncbi:molybdopterin molybdochelatase [Desulfotomaculum arcticum]|uniref:Molybdopterin molybdenumtransferase n=1 Tax=Desulfotruncus arcticus DSM 17038 TaxID=1121424 RepID=A0A1I2YX40_9FIRM|nr:gephyrin-like molybdotransferase Glp [Desulfotruncus arcticus]SFH30030.1 molybdopterin molybdochelatase [Desulfotomaculum arcticum] [Desulfotruncus arcticus DSM 17038]